jgi:Sulfotransferase family
MTASAELTVAALMSDRRPPDFFIVGHHKSGTTALYQMLRRHPQIFMPDVKEPRFFASDLRPLLRPPDGMLPETFDEYLALFDGAKPGQRIGEASPSYLRSRTAAAAIAEVQPAARIIAILREPASFVRSLHLQMLQEHVETEKDLRTAVEREDIVRHGQRVRRYSDHVRYAEQVRRYHAAFPPEQVLVLIYDDFRSDNEATVRRVLGFLEVDDTHPIEVVEANPAVGLRAVRLDAIVRSLYAGRSPAARAARASAKAITSAELRSSLLRTLRRRVVYSPPPPPDEDFMGELRHRFRAEVIAVSEYLDRDLVRLWGYDNLG